jgi:hypothetical protein
LQSVLIGSRSLRLREAADVRHFWLVWLSMLALGLGIIAASLGTDAQAPSTKIRIIYTNDTLGYLEPCG